MIIIGDLHLKNKEPYLSASKKFLDYLTEQYDDVNMIFLGDVFDSSAPIWEVYKIFKEFLLKRKAYTYILNGNHDMSKSKGCSLSSFNLLDKIKVFEEEEVIEIDDLNCLMLPFKYDYKSYENLEGKYDFIFTHIMPVETQFANEGLEFSKLKGCFIHGHNHIQLDYTDKYPNQHCILGVPLPTRHGEDQDHRIMKIDDKGKLEIIKVPFYFKHETIKYGETPSSTTNIINVIDAPNKKLVYEKYKEYYIRDAGIKLLRTENTQESFKAEFEEGNILDKFKKYSSDKALSKEVAECCSTRLLGII